jgi:hypothetical protein
MVGWVFKVEERHLAIGSRYCCGPTWANHPAEEHAAGHCHTDRQSHVLVSNGHYVRAKHAPPPCLETGRDRVRQ